MAPTGAERGRGNSDCRDTEAKGQDTEGICGGKGPGTFLVENNYLEAAG